MGNHIVSLLVSSNGGGGLLPKVILVAADFPTTAEANTHVGRIYVAGANVTDNDPTKTNTSQSFISGQEFIWDGVSAYIILGDQALWTDDGTDLQSLNIRNINLKNEGLKDANVTTPVKLGDPSNTSFDTVNKTIIGAVNETLSNILVPETEKFTVANDGDINFTLTQGTPASDDNFDLFRNGIHAELGVDYSRSGVNITWLNATSSAGSLLAGELLTARYNKSSGLANKSLLVFGNNNISATTVTRYMNPYTVNATASTTIINLVIPFSGTIRNMHVYHNNTAGNGNNIVYTLLKNATSTALTVTIPSTTQTASDTSNSVSISAGDRLALEVTKALGIGSSPSDICVSMEAN